MLDLLPVLGTCTQIKIDPAVPAVVRTLITTIKIAVPIGLIIFGMLDLGKAVISNDEKAMKEGQGKFIKRCMYAAIVFFIVAIVQFVVRIVTDSQYGDSDYSSKYLDCVACFVSDGTKCYKP